MKIDSPEIQARIGKLMLSRHATLSAAESCTGGQISHLLTTVSGSSAYYLGSVTSYAIPVKEKVLGVPAETIERNGVVSSEVAAAMAEGVMRLTGSTYSVSTTGLAEGGDGRYPEGTVWMGVSGPAGTRTRIFRHQGNREENIESFAENALLFLEEYLLEEA